MKRLHFSWVGNDNKLTVKPDYFSIENGLPVVEDWWLHLKKKDKLNSQVTQTTDA